MSVNTAPQVPTLVEGEVNNFAVSFANVLDPGELLTGTPTVTEEVTSDLVINYVAVNVAALRINGRTVELGKAVQFHASGQLASTGSYTLVITITTDATPAQTKIRSIRFCVENP
jgi:hypothetical protein